MKKYENKITTKFNDIVIMKQIYNFIKFYYNTFKVISVEIDLDEVNIYFERRVYNQYKDVIELQKEIKDYLLNNLDYKASKINIIKV